MLFIGIFINAPRDMFAVIELDNTTFEKVPCLQSSTTLYRLRMNHGNFKRQWLMVQMHVNVIAHREAAKLSRNKNKRSY